MYYRIQQPTPTTVPSSLPKALGCLLAYLYRKDERVQPVKLMCCKFFLPSTLQQIRCVSIYLCPRPPPPLLSYSFSSPSFSSSPPPTHSLLLPTPPTLSPLLPPPLLPPLYILHSCLSLLILLSSFPYSFSSNSLFSSSLSPSSSPLLPPLLPPLLILISSLFVLLSFSLPYSFSFSLLPLIVSETIYITKCCLIIRIYQR